MSEKKQHILVISQYFYPEEFRINDICKEWVKRGYEVTVVTGIPNYTKGKFYPGYSWFKQRTEEYEGIHIIRLPLIPCYIYVQDLWPENVEIVTGIHNRKMIGAIDRMVDYIYRRCTKIFATSPSFVKRIEERDSAYETTEKKETEQSSRKSQVIYWLQYAEDFYSPVEKQPLPDVEDDERLKIVFTGNIGYAQGLDILPKVAELLKKDRQKVRFYIIGDGRYREELEKIIQEKDVSDMFRLLGRKKPEEIPAYMAHFDIAFLSFADNELFQMTIPAKLQSYMACGMPILAVADGEARRIIDEAEFGICTQAGDLEGIYKNVLYCMKASRLQREQYSQKSIKYHATFFEKNAILAFMDFCLA